MNLVEVQLIAYNARDVEVFKGCFAPDVRILNGLGEVVLDGWEARRERYAEHDVARVRVSERAPAEGLGQNVVNEFPSERERFRGVADDL